MTVINFLGVNITPVLLEDLIRYFGHVITTNERARIFYINVHGVNLAAADPRFCRVINQADIVFCDGYGVRIGARLLGHRIPERFTLPDWIGQLSDYCQEQGFSLFLLGSRPGVSEHVADILKRRYPRLNVVGTYHGYFNKARSSHENAEVIAKINAAKPDILIVGFGMPIQEYWLDENWDALAVRVALTGGAAFDFIAGVTQRGPKWMTDHGLEWLSRLLIEPHRLWKRYLVGNPLFLLRVLGARIGLTMPTTTDDRTRTSKRDVNNA